MHRNNSWWEALGSLWKLGCITDRTLCGLVRVDRESFRVQRNRRGWKLESPATLDDMRKRVDEQEIREMRGMWARRGWASKVEPMRLKLGERKAEFEARLAYLRGLPTGAERKQKPVVVSAGKRGTPDAQSWAIQADRVIGR